MRFFGIFICVVLLSVQGFAAKGGAGKNARQLKDLLRNQTWIEKIATLGGRLPTEVYSGNLGKVLLSAAAGVGMLFAVTTTADANLEKRAKELDKKLGATSGKVIDVGGGIEMDASAKLTGNYAGYGGSYEGKDDSLTLGIGLDTAFRGELTRLGLSELGLSGSITSNNTKRYGEEDFNGTMDYTGRAIFTQSLPVLPDAIINPNIFVESNGAQYGKVKRQVNIAAGLGLKTSWEMWGERDEVVSARRYWWFVGRQVRRWRWLC